MLGQTFTTASLAAVSGEPGPELAGPLRDLVRQEVLSLNRDPRSPERGQYGFVQALIREVAYGTLARRDRRTRHLAAASATSSRWVTTRRVGVLATHYLDAYRVSEPGPEAEAIAAQARIALRAAAERAVALHSPAAGARLPRAGARGDARPGRTGGPAGDERRRRRGGGPVRGRAQRHSVRRRRPTGTSAT